MSGRVPGAKSSQRMDIPKAVPLPAEQALLNFRPWYQDMRRQRNFAFGIAATSLVAVFVAFGIVLYALNLPRIKPLMVVLNENGSAKTVGVIDENNSSYSFAIPDNALRYQIREFFKNAFTITTDQAVNQDKIDQAFSFTTADTYGVLRQILTDRKPFDKTGRERDEVRIETLLSQEGNRWVCDFFVDIYDMAGNKTGQQKYRAAFTIATANPPPVEVIERNSLGIFFTMFEMQEIKE